MSFFKPKNRNARYKPPLAWLAWFTVAWTLLLLLMGGFTTSIGAGMVFLDWPLSDGSLNPEGWLGDRDMFAEHSHRLLGAQVGLLVMAIGLWLYFREGRRWLRRLGAAAFILVSIQGLLGGGRVVFDQLNLQTDHNLLAQTLAIVHACTAQAFLCVVVAMAAALSRFWIEDNGGLARAPERAVRTWGAAACAVLFVQLILGAVMRHHDAGMAIPHFPLSSADSLLPPAWNFQVGIHFAHRIGAIAVTLVLAGFAWKVWRSDAFATAHRTVCATMLLLLGAQIYLGASIIWYNRNPYPTTLHVIAGAVLLALAWLLTFLSFRRFEGAPQPARAAPTAGDARHNPHAGREPAAAR